MKNVKPRRLKILLKSPGMQRDLTKEKMYQKRFKHFWSFETIDLTFLVLIAFLYVTGIVFKLGLIGYILISVAGLGTGLIFLSLIIAGFYRWKCHVWQKRINHLLITHDLKQYINNIKN